MCIKGHVHVHASLWWFTMLLRHISVCGDGSTVWLCNLLLMLLLLWCLVRQAA